MQETDLVLGSERSPREGNGNPLQCSSLGNTMNRVATVCVVAKSWTWLVNVTQTHSLSLYAAAASAAAAKSLQSCQTL